MSANGQAPNCTDVTNLPAGKLLIETVNGQSTAALDLYLSVPASGGNAAPLQVPLTADAAGEYTGAIETGLVIHDGAAGLTAGETYRSETIPLKLCVKDDTASGSFGSGWFLTGRVLP